MRDAVAASIFATVITVAGLTPLATGTSFQRQADDEAREFVAAAQRGDGNAVRRGLERNPGLVRATDDLGMTALDWAATREHWYIFRQLLEAGAPVGSVGFDGGTVLHRAAHYDRADMVALLLDAGADLAVQNRWGRTPLHVAARRGCRSVAALLLERGADPDVTTREGWTSLHVAYRAGQPQLVELLLAAGADGQARDTAGALPIDLAFKRPAAISIETSRLYEYQGLYDVSDDFHFKVWVEGDRLMLQDFGADGLYATGPDAFFCRSEPWKVLFRRGADGAVNGIEVQFLRRVVKGVRRGHPQYVGSHECRSCHLGEEHGNQYIRWLSSRHAAAYWRLATDWALFLAKRRPYYRDMDDPRRDDRCLLCHSTGRQDPDALFASSYDVSQGVGCETCHGPASKYMDAAVMSDRAKFTAAGGVVPDESTCRKCHRDGSFTFHEFWPEVAHPRPSGTP